MITPDDNGYGRVKRWREKNRAYVNLKQREYRRRKKGVQVASEKLIAGGSNPSTPPQPTIEELRKLIRGDQGGIPDGGVVKESFVERDEYSQC